MAIRDRKTRKHRNRDRASSARSVEHRANILDRATGQTYVQLQFKTIDGRGRMEVPRSELMRPTTVLAKLLDRNADLDIAGNSKHALDEVKHAIEQEPRFRCEHVAQAGWHDGFSAYATKDRVISYRRTKRVPLPPRQDGKPSSAPNRDGNLASWKREVAAPCCHSRLGVFLLAAGFAPLLQKLTNTPIFGLNVYGPSKSGKSTMLLAIGSIYGARYESDLINFATTDAALGEMCRLYNSALLPLNEMGLIRGDRSQAYRVLRSWMFQISEGTEYRRHSKSGYAVVEDLSKYRLIFVMTAEHPISFYAAEAGQLQDDGELARCIDVQAVAEGQTSMVDLDLEDLDLDEGESAAVAVNKQIRRGCARNGGAMPALSFAERIMADPEGVKREVQRIQARFIELATTEDSDDVERHRAMCFGVIAAAGQLACRWGLIPFDEGRMLKVVLGIFRSACGVRARTANSMRAVQEHLRKKLLTLPKEDDVAARHADCEGFRQPSNGVRYVVHEATFKRWFMDDPAHYTWITKWLADRDAFVRVARQAAGAKGNTTSHTMKWPNGKVTRCVILRRDPLLRERRGD